MFLCILMYLFPLLCYSHTKTVNSEKEEFCKKVDECVSDSIRVCGIRWEGEKIRLKIFPDQCELLKYGCSVEEEDAYGMIHMNYCAETSNQNASNCTEECPEPAGNRTVCALRPHHQGFKARLFVSQCAVRNYNCEHNLTDHGFNMTDDYVCDGLDLPAYSEKAKNTSQMLQTNRSEFEKYSGEQSAAVSSRRPKTVVVVDGSLFDTGGDANSTVENFFSATHVFDLPLKDVTRTLDERTRRVMLKTYGPVVVYKPWIKIPETINTDIWHKPTLDSCFHQCPVTCPNTYSPVCGNPGTGAREPSLMFKNHCLMDAAQCFMRFQNASYTAPAASYIESTFVFCLGEQLNGLYRFLPLVRTLQRMGRLRKKGNYHIRLRNMRFFNEMLKKTPRVMG